MVKKTHQKSSKVKTNITNNKWLWIELVSAFLSIVFLYGIVVIIDGIRFITFSGITLSLIGLVMMINAGFALSSPKDNEKLKKLFISGHAINKRYIFGFAFIILGYALQITGLFK